MRYNNHNKSRALIVTCTDLLIKSKEKNTVQASPEGRSFWEEQLCAATTNNHCQVCWHPLII